MQANSYAAFGGRVVFTTRPSSVESRSIWRRFQEIANSLEHPIKTELEGGDTQMGYLISHTACIEFTFQGNETPLLTSFRDLWQQWQQFDTDGVKAALDWRMKCPDVFIEEWTAALDTRDALWIDPVIAPVELLTPEQQEQAADPESPLLKPAKQRGKETSSE